MRKTFDIVDKPEDKLDEHFGQEKNIEFLIDTFFFPLLAGRKVQHALLVGPPGGGKVVPHLV